MLKVRVIPCLDVKDGRVVKGVQFVDLKDAGDPVEAAARLFDVLRQADRLGRPIAVAPIPDAGLGAAINDRLRRAAAPR